MKLNHTQYQMVSAMILGRLMDKHRKACELVRAEVDELTKSEQSAQLKSLMASNRAALNRIKKIDAQCAEIDKQSRALRAKRDELSKKSDALQSELNAQGLRREHGYGNWSVPSIKKSERLTKAEAKLSEVTAKEPVYRKLDQIMGAIVLLDSPQVTAFLKENGIDISIPK